MCEEFLYDRTIHFDISPPKLQMLKGERTLFLFSNVEDVKGNPDQLGQLAITNIRVMWWCTANPSINLSIGLGTLFYQEYKASAQTTLFRTKLASGQRYEFNFQCSDTKLHEHLSAVSKLYSQTTMYREIKVQVAMVAQKKLIPLNKEQIINSYTNTISVANDQQDVVGTLVLTNIRFVWFSANNDLFNISIPWIAVKKVGKKNTKGQNTMVVETHFEFGGYFVGYRNQTMDPLLKEFSKLHQFFIENPNYGIEFQEKVQVPQQQFNEQVRIIQSGYNQATKYQQQDSNESDIIVSAELGVAVERTQEKLSDLWNIVKI